MSWDTYNKISDCSTMHPVLYFKHAMPLVIRTTRVLNIICKTCLIVLVFGKPPLFQTSCLKIIPANKMLIKMFLLSQVLSFKVFPINGCRISRSYVLGVPWMYMRPLSILRPGENGENREPSDDFISNLIYSKYYTPQ